MADRLLALEEQLRTLLASNAALATRVQVLESKVLPPPPKTPAEIEEDKRWEEEQRLKRLEEVNKKRYGPTREYPSPLKGVAIERGPSITQRIIPGQQFQE